MSINLPKINEMNDFIVNTVHIPAQRSVNLLKTHNTKVIKTFESSLKTQIEFPFHFHCNSK